jgi:hypothetical protein
MHLDFLVLIAIKYVIEMFSSKFDVYNWYSGIVNYIYYTLY